MSDAPDDLGIPMKPARGPGASANVAPLGRGPSPVPPRTPDPPRPGPATAETPRSVEIMPRPAPPPPAPRRNDTEPRKLIVGREISLSGEIASCDKLIVEGAVEANACRAATRSRSPKPAPSRARRRSTKPKSAVDLTAIWWSVSACSVRSSGRVSRDDPLWPDREIRYGGQISGDVQAQSAEDFVSDIPTTPAPPFNL